MRLAAALVLILALASVQAGEACTPTTTRPTLDVGGRYYVDIDCGNPMGCHGSVFMLSIWVYEEANGIPGLQRGDDLVDDTCGGMISRDRVVV